MSFPSLAFGVGNDPESVSAVSGTHGTSRNNGRPCGVAEGLQVRQNFVEAHRDMPSNIFTEHHAGSCVRNNSAHDRPEVTVILFASSEAGHTERLARVSAGNKVDCSIVFRVESFHIVVDWHAREVLVKDTPRPWVNFAECHRFDSANHLSRKRKSSNATEQIKMPNKAWEGNADNVCCEFELHFRRASTLSLAEEQILRNRNEMTPTTITVLIALAQITTTLSVPFINARLAKLKPKEAPAEKLMKPTSGRPRRSWDWSSLLIVVVNLAGFNWIVFRQIPLDVVSVASICFSVGGIFTGVLLHFISQYYWWLRDDFRDLEQELFRKRNEEG
jgi:hypothetical protein